MRLSHFVVILLCLVCCVQGWGQVNQELKAENRGFRLPEIRAYYEEWETAYDYERDMALSTLSDVFKEVNGWRPRDYYNTEEMTLTDIEEEISRIVRIDEARKEEALRGEERLARKMHEATNPTPLTHNPFAALKDVL